jgi:RNA polymerase sigma-70 factor (ECF subfamily)
MPEADSFYVARCLDGYADDYRHLVRRYQGALLVHLGGRLDIRGQAEEAAQEVFVRAFYNLRKLRKPDSFFPWLFGIANHVAQELNRRTRAELKQREGYPVAQRVANGTESDRQADHDLATAVAGLQDPYKEVILLRFYADCSCIEMAQRLGVPVGTVTKRLSRAYAEIRKRLPNQSAWGAT